LRKKVIVSFTAALICSVSLTSTMMAADTVKKENFENKVDKKHLAEEVSILADLDPEKATGMRIEGITGDKAGRLYTIDTDSRRLFRVLPDTGKVEVLTVLPRSATGMAFDEDGNLYMASGGSATQEGVILRVRADTLQGAEFDSSQVETFVSGVNGANGLVFDREGNLYVSGGATGNIYVIKPTGERTVWASGITAERTEQLIVVNGLAFGQDGRLYIANTSSGEINRVRIKEDGTFSEVQRVVKDPLLYGADGIAFAGDGSLFVCANERNAIIRVSPSGKVSEVAVNDNQGPLEFPASLHFVGKTLYVSNFDIARGMNSPNTPGIGASIAKIEFMKTRD
jgi:sugar lactone lactonase YvrE